MHVCVYVCVVCVWAHTAPKQAVNSSTHAHYSFKFLALIRFKIALPICFIRLRITTRRRAACLASACFHTCFPNRCHHDILDPTRYVHSFCLCIYSMKTTSLVEDYICSICSFVGRYYTTLGMIQFIVVISVVLQHLAFVDIDASTLHIYISRHTETSIKSSNALSFWSVEARCWRRFRRIFEVQYRAWNWWSVTPICLGVRKQLRSLTDYCIYCK